jgi:hypothetical protein
MQCQSGRKGTVEVAGKVEEQQTQGSVLKKKRTEKKPLAGFQVAVESVVPVGVVSSVRVALVITHLLHKHA